MMSEERNFDFFVKSELADLSPTVSPRIWENIVAERRKRKPVGFWISFFTTKNVMLVLGGLVIVSSAILFLNRSDYSKKAERATNTNAIASIAQSTTVNSQKNITGADATKSLLSPDQQLVSGIEKNQNNNIYQTGEIKNNQQQNSVAIYPLTSIQKPDEETELLDDGNAHTYGETLMSRLLFGTMNTAAAEQSSAMLQNRKFPNVALPGCPTVEEAAAGNKRYIEMYAGPDFTLRNFKDTSKSEYLQKRKASTKVSSAYSAGIRYTRVFNNGMSIKAGVNYSQVNEKFSFVQSNLIQTTYIVDPVSGDTTASYTVTGTRTKTTYNKYRTLDIPLLVGYELGNGRLHVNINAGAMINIYSWQKGEVLDTTYQPVTITTGKSTTSPYQFKNNVGVGLTGGIGVYYKITDQLHVLAEPYFRYNLQPMSKAGLTLQQKYNTVGLHVGVRLDLK
ncbi:PorT family protein [Ferruginibacter lapsinanis]|uniref:PorT family protein n=1 Tax=Ferruginibacter lapsinanis TaxID=563172 RepID=UPI001E59FED6|nr:PorT family protein [Ferruginibacter lapsinanis]UEG50588.1 PorT family protein [Ferruginibacter lapsinanis]